MNRSLILRRHQQVHLLNDRINARDAVLGSEFLDRIVPDALSISRNPNEKKDIYQTGYVKRALVVALLPIPP